MTLEHINQALPILVTILASIGGALVARARGERDWFERLLRAVPDVWEAVQQERSKGLVAVTRSPLDVAMGKLAAMKPGKLPASMQERLRAALQAEHERRGAPSPQPRQR